MECFLLFNRDLRLVWQFPVVLPTNSCFSLPFWGKSFGPNRKIVIMDLFDITVTAGKNSSFSEGLYVEFEQQIWEIQVQHLNLFVKFQLLNLMLQPKLWELLNLESDIWYFWQGEVGTSTGYMWEMTGMLFGLVSLSPCTKAPFRCNLT